MAEILVKLLAQLKSIPFGSIWKSLWGYLVQFFQWLLIPVPFALGPLLILCALSFRSCQGQRTVEAKNVILTDSLKLALSDVRYLRADTANLRKLNRNYKTELSKTNEAFENYRRYVLSLTNDDLQREIDRVFNRPGQPQ